MCESPGDADGAGEANSEAMDGRDPRARATITDTDSVTVTGEFAAAVLESDRAPEEFTVVAADGPTVGDLDREPDREAADD